MTETMKFNGNSVAQNYDNGLVPILFTPWSKQMVNDHGPWEGKMVLDLAAGTGTVSEFISQKIGNGRLVGLDLSSDMLEIARDRVPSATFVEASAERIPIEDNSFDIIVCQQGFQFFPNKSKVTKELHRLLKPGGKMVITTWLPVERCEFFGIICDILEEMNYNEISAIMRKPFEFDLDEMLECLTIAGFRDISMIEQDKEMIVNENSKAPISMAYSTPIAPMLRELPVEVQEIFKKRLISRTAKFGPQSLGLMVTTLITANV